MIRAHPPLPVSGALTLFVLALLLPLLLAPPPASAAPQHGQSLGVRLDSITPATIPAHGPITLAGTVTNRTHETWRDINVQPLTSMSPITDATDLAEATASEPDSYIGNRLTEASLFAQVGDLAPGERIHFRIKVPRAKLQITGAPGVYWLGVHALGLPDGGVRDDVADGRARTFIPLLPAGARASVSLVLPLRGKVQRAPDTSVAGPRELVKQLTPDGRLGRITALADSAGIDPLTWLVDPDLLDAVSTVADDNPPLDVGRASRTQGSPSSSPSPTGQGGPTAPDLDQADRSTAAQWFDAATRLLTGSHVLALPYGDTDVSAVATGRQALLARARSLSESTLADMKINASPAIAPPNGYLAPGATDRLAGGATVLLSDHGDGTRRPASLSTGQRVLFSDATASNGGPRPGPTHSALLVRQQVLASAALAAMRGQRAPVVVVLPPGWDPGAHWQQADFFGGLDQPWLRLRPLPRRGAAPLSRPLAYPKRAKKTEISPENQLLAGQLMHEGDLLAALVDDGDDLDTTIRNRIGATALAGVSYHAHHHPVYARSRLRDLGTRTRKLLDSVSLTGTEFVTLSSSSGTLTVSLVNGIDQPIRVGVHATTDGRGIRIDNFKPIKLAAGQRSTLRLHAHASAIGVHQVAVTPVTADGRPFGTPLTFSLRTSEVGQWFWVGLICVGSLLVLLILRRIVLRIRSHQWRRKT